MIDKQDIFNRAVLGIIAQGCASYTTEGDMCAYRGPNGTKCAIGHIIPNVRYRKALEGSSVADPAVIDAAFGKDNSLEEDEFSFLEQLQDCHDGAAIDLKGIDFSAPARSYLRSNEDFIAEFKRRIVVFAKDYSLTIPQEAL